MFKSQIKILNQNSQYLQNIHKIFITENEKQLCFKEVIELWKNDKEFRDFFISLLAQTPFPSFRWETPPITKATVNRLFEFVLINARLTNTSDSRVFSSHVVNAKSRKETVTSFVNLGKDAFLVVPVPNDISDLSAYAHLAAFSRKATDSQNHILWKTVGETLEDKLAETPIWLNTAGAGVPWLHIRLDSKPKYYRFEEYKINE